MLSKNSYSSFEERPEYKAEQSLLRLPLLSTNVIEGLLHGLAKSLPEFSWIEVEEFPVENMNCSPVIRHTQSSSGKASALVPP